MAGQDDMRLVLSHLHRVLPRTGCVQIELTSMLDDDLAGTCEERIAHWSSCIDDGWRERLRVIAHVNSDGHGLRYLPNPRGHGYMAEWAMIRVGHMPWAMQGKAFARCQGLSEALIAWRVKLDLRAPLSGRPNHRWARVDQHHSIPV